MHDVHRLVVFAAASFLLAASPLGAQWSTNPNVNNPVCIVAANQYGTVSVGDDSGGTIIVWLDERNGNNDIYAQRVDVTGNIRWTGGGVPVCTTVGDQHNPKIIRDGRGGAIIVWEDYQYGTGDVDMYAQMLNAAGVPQWSQPGVPDGVVVDASAYNTRNIAVATDGAHGVVVVWEDGRNGASNFDIFAQRVDSTGARRWGTNGNSMCNAALNQLHPVVTTDDQGTGILYIAWDDFRAGGNGDIYVQEVDQLGTIYFGADGSAVCTDPGSQQRVAMASAGGGASIVAWVDSRGNGSLYARGVSVFGVAWQADGVLIDTLGAICLCSSLGVIAVSDEAGGAVLGWAFEIRGFTGENGIMIHAGRVSGGGVRQWVEDVFTTISYATSWSKNWSMISDQGGGAIISWPSWATTTGDSCGPLYVQRVDGSGTLRWGPSGLALSTAQNGKYLPAQASNGRRGTILAWHDTRNSVSNPKETDIYCQQVDSTGSLGGVPLPVHLISLRASVSGTNAELRWVTATETDNYGFGVERRAVNYQRSAGSWKSVGFVSGFGSSSSLQEYSFIDRSPSPGRYAYRLKQIDRKGSFAYSGAVEIEVGIAPTEFTLSRNFPNPFNPSTEFEYTLPEAGRVRLSVFNILGQEVVVLVNGFQGAGTYPVTFEAGTLPSGVYVTRLEAGGSVRTERMLLLK